MGCQVRVVGPPTLIPAEVADLGVEVFHDMAAGLAGADMVMMLRLQTRADVARPGPQRARVFPLLRPGRGRSWRTPSPTRIVMHPGPMNRGVEIDSAVADDPVRSVIKEQVEMGVAVRMAVLDMLSRGHRRNEP